MAKFSKLFKISISFIFVVFFVLLFLTIFSEKIPSFNSNEKKLRRLSDDEIAIFTIFKYFDYCFFPFLGVSFFVPCIYCSENNEGQDQKKERENGAFVLNNVCYIINLLFLTISCVNFIHLVQFNYSLTVFIFSLLYFLIRSTIYIGVSIKCKDSCFRGICEWGYLKLLYTAGCCFFAPCKNKGCRDVLTCSEECNCCFGLVYFIGVICHIVFTPIYYFGLLIFSIFWLIGKFFVFISCCDCCWCKEEYDIVDFMFNGTSNTPLNISDREEDKVDETKKEIKKIVKTLPKDKKDFFKFSKKIFSGFKKKIKEEEKK